MIPSASSCTRRRAAKLLTAAAALAAFVTTPPSPPPAAAAPASDAVDHGSSGLAAGGGVVGIAASPATGGSWLATGRRRVDLGLFAATCYALRGSTASGRPVGNDVIAVDRRVIPLGTRVLVEGIGERIAADTGSDIVRRRIDVWKPTNGECRAFGRRTLHLWRLS